jgi:hypothetical protein
LNEQQCRIAFIANTYIKSFYSNPNGKTKIMVALSLLQVLRIVELEVDGNVPW